MPFDFRTSGWTGLDLNIFHEYIFFDDGTNIGFTATGLFSETDPKIIIAKYKCSRKHYDDLKMKKAVNQVEEMRVVLPKSSNRHDGVVIGKNMGITHIETFAKFLSFQQPKPKHRFSAVFASNHS